MLRESLERSARESDRWIPLHDACATTMQIRYAASADPGLAERVGRHLYESERYDEAIEPLRQAAQEHRQISAYGDSMRFCDQWISCMEHLSTHESDPLWGSVQTNRADLLMFQGELEQAERAALKAVEDGKRFGWDEVLAPALRTAGSAAAKRGRLEVAAERYRAGGEQASRAGFEDERARSLLALGDVERLQGDHGAARRTVSEALRIFTARRDPHGQAFGLLGLAAVSKAAGRLNEAEDLIRRAIPMCERAGNRFGLASCYNTLGEVLRGREQLDEAADAYQRAETLFHSLGSAEGQVPRLNLGLILLSQREFGRAGERLGKVLATCQQDGRRGLEGIMHALILPCMAHAEDWSGWREHFEAQRTLLAESGLVDGDIGMAAEIAGKEAQRLGADQQARSAFQLALAQYSGVGDRESQSRITSLLQRSYT